MVGGIASCCISSNEQWQIHRRHNKSPAPLEVLNAMLSLLHGVTADEQADWLGVHYSYYSFTGAALLSHAVNSLQILVYFDEPVQLSLRNIGLFLDALQATRDFQSYYCLGNI